MKAVEESGIDSLKTALHVRQRQTDVRVLDSMCFFKEAIELKSQKN